MTQSAPYQEEELRWSDWMRRAQGGDRACYERLLRETGEVIEVYLRVRFGKLDVLEDCVQECLLALHLARHTYDPQRPFRPWMFTIVRHRTIDVLRARRSRLMLERSIAADEPSSGDGDHLLQHALGIRVLEGLPPDHRDAVVLTQYAGYTTAEAAAWLGVSTPALKARLHRGLKAIRKQLEEESRNP